MCVISDDYVAGTDVFGKCYRVLYCLCESLIEVFPRGLMFGNEFPRLEEVNESAAAAELLYLLLKDGDRATFYAEYIEEFVPKSLVFSGFACLIFPGMGKSRRSVAYLVPGEHGDTILHKTSLC